MPEREGRKLSLGVLEKESLYLVLGRIDEALSERARQRGCGRCGGPLHRAGYLRKPRGVSLDLPEGLRRRRGLCCGHCRQRVLPRSVLFWGRRVYWAAVVVVVSGCRLSQPVRATLGQLGRLLGVSRQSVSRWCRYFVGVFPESMGGKLLRSRLVPQAGGRELLTGALEALVAVSKSPGAALARWLVLVLAPEELSVREQAG